MSYENTNLRFKSERFDSYGLKVPSTPVNVNFVLGYHGCADDFPLTMRQDHEQAHLVLHEFLAWTPDYEDTLNNFAKGVQGADLVDTSLNIRKKELIANTSAHQSLWDIPAANIAAPRYYQYHVQGEFNADMVSLKRRPEVARDVMERYFLMIEGRDKYGVKAISRNINTLAQNHEGEMNVLVIAGLAHVAMANAYATLSDKSEHLTVTISSNHDQICVDALSSYIMARHKKGELSDEEVYEFRERLVQEARLDMSQGSTHHALARHYGAQ
jgi:hypothetical protein